MSVEIVRFCIVPLVLGFLFVACSQGEKEPEFPLNTEAFASYDDETAEYPHLVFPDGSVSVNDRCPVRRSKLNRRMPPLYVNGRPIGFC